MKAVVAAFNQEKALVGAFSVITNLRMELFQALDNIESIWRAFFIGCQRGDAAAGAVMGILEVLMPDDLLPTIYISNSAKSAVVAGEMLL